MSIHKWMVGFVLTMVMIAAIGINALLFSARDFQFGLAQVSPETNGLISIPRLLEVDERIGKIAADTATPRGELLQVRSAIETADGNIASAEARLNGARAEIAGQLAVIESGASVTPDESLLFAFDSASLNVRASTLAQHPGLTPEAQQQIAALMGQIDQVARMENELVSLDNERVELVTRERFVGAQVAESDREVFALQQSVVPNYEHYQRVKSEILALRNGSPIGVAASIAQWHPATVSTVLVLLMGALGAILYLFPAYLNRAQPVTFAEIAVRLIFGMCAALAFYMLANATIAGFSMNSGVQQASTSATLNPFTVSLIGIVAGVLAEDIAKWIQDRGKGIFTPGVQAQTRDASVSQPVPPAAAPSAADGPPGGGLVNNQAIS